MIYNLSERQIACGKIGDWKIVGVVEDEQEAINWVSAKSKISRKYISQGFTQDYLNGNFDASYE